MKNILGQKNTQQDRAWWTTGEASTISNKQFLTSDIASSNLAYGQFEKDV